ncbi:hypothetical protein N3K66_004872 [Trichothecium roseum]|uniref:Uncharacterized protein n=1 Tax=Trichothecium roseum TaxID=47278 RepID=A0ACC0V2G3_9HYPO|nr:hypothetical protein N3K66_004872 [Trichothecium roseum]
MTSVLTSTAAHSTGAMTWQERLDEFCRESQLSPPVFQMFSDRRGGRTAWTSKVTIDGQVLSARFWYDGKNINNAKEDAAEQAMLWLTSAY